MTASRSLLLALTFCGCLSVISAAIIGEFVCLPTPTPGSFAVKLKENKALVLGWVQQVDAGAVCGANIALTVETDNGIRDRILSFTLDVTGACGVTDLTGGRYQLDFITKSLTEGYSSLDASFSIICDFTITTMDIQLANPMDIFNALDTVDGKEIKPSFSITLQSRDRPATDATPVAWANIVSGTKVTLLKQLRIVIQLLSSSSPVAQFGVMKCWFTATDGTTPRSSTIIDAVGGDETKICPTKDGKVLGFNPLVHGFTNSPDTLAESAAFDSFTLFRTVGTAPTITLTCTVIYCVSGCKKDGSDCSANPARRKRRSVEERFNSTQLNVAFSVTTNPNDVQAANKDSGSSSSDCPTVSNMGYLVALIVLAAMLVFTVAVTIFMFTRLNRRHDLSNTKA